MNVLKQNRITKARLGMTPKFQVGDRIKVCTAGFAGIGTIVSVAWRNWNATAYNDPLYKPHFEYKVVLDYRNMKLRVAQYYLVHTED